MSGTITIEKDKLEHLLNCMALLDFKKPLHSEINTEIIENAYHEACDWLTVKVSLESRQGVLSEFPQNIEWDLDGKKISLNEYQCTPKCNNSDCQNLADYAFWNNNPSSFAYYCRSCTPKYVENWSYSKTLYKAPGFCSLIVNPFQDN